MFQMGPWACPGEREMELSAGASLALRKAPSEPVFHKIRQEWTLGGSVDGSPAQGQGTGPGPDPAIH